MEELGIQRIVIQFLAVVPHSRINFEQIKLISAWDDQLSFMERTICSPVVKNYPLKYSYQIQFLKRLILELEKLTPEIHDRIYEELTDLQKMEKSNAQEWSYKHFLVDKEVISIKETPQIISQGTTGLVTWQAGIFLADWMSTNCNLFRDKVIVELGSGTGVTGVLASKLCHPKQLYLTDCHSKVLDLLKENTILNQCQNTRVLNLDWDRPLEEQETEMPDYLLAADILYDNEIFRPLLKVLNWFSKRSENLQIFLACTVRNADTLTEFLALLQSSGFDYQIIITSKELSNRFHWDPTTEIRLYKITSKK